MHFPQRRVPTPEFQNAMYDGVDAHSFQKCASHGTMNAPYHPVKHSMPLLKRQIANGFSLVEVTIALGILSFAMISLFGLLPVGMQVFRDAIDTTVQTQIVQAITGLAEQTDFANLNVKVGTQTVATKLLGVDESLAPSLRALAVNTAGNTFYFFNDEGQRVAQANAIYTAAVTYWVPKKDDAPNPKDPNLPANRTSESFATMWIDIYNNKGILVGGIPAGKPQTFPLHIADFGKRI